MTTAPGAADPANRSYSRSLPFAKRNFTASMWNRRERAAVLTLRISGWGPSRRALMAEVPTLTGSPGSFGQLERLERLEQVMAAAVVDERR
jgi:hypothetical protein